MKNSEEHDLIILNGKRGPLQDIVAIYMLDIFKFDQSHYIAERELRADKNMTPEDRLQELYTNNQDPEKNGKTMIVAYEHGHTVVADAFNVLFISLRDIINVEMLEGLYKRNGGPYDYIVNDVDSDLPDRIAERIVINYGRWSNGAQCDTHIINEIHMRDLFNTKPVICLVSPDAIEKGLIYEQLEKRHRILASNPVQPIFRVVRARAWMDLHLGKEMIIINLTVSLKQDENKNIIPAVEEPWYHHDILPTLKELEQTPGVSIYSVDGEKSIQEEVNMIVLKLVEHQLKSKQKNVVV